MGFLMALTDAFVRNVKPEGKLKRYADGNGLYLVVQPLPGGSKSWVQRITVDGKRVDRGLGPYPAVTLKEARKKALTNRAAIADGQNPFAPPPSPSLTFSELAAEYIDGRTDLEPRTRFDWYSTLTRHAAPLGPMQVDRVRRADILEVLLPIWTGKPEMAAKVARRLRTIFEAAVVRELAEYNVAAFDTRAALPRQPAREHYRALDWREVPEAVRAVEASSAGLSARTCFAFLVLTAVRSGEARGATWDEIDMDSATWTIPPARMKGGKRKERDHRVPLSGQSLDALERMRPVRDESGLIFPSTRAGRPMSDMTLTRVLERVGLSDRTVVHGFRSSFRTWAQEHGAPWEVAELALSHTVGDSVHQAYARSPMLDERRPIMQAWADFVIPR